MHTLKGAGAAFTIWKAWHSRWSVGRTTVLSIEDMMPGERALAAEQASTEALSALRTQAAAEGNSCSAGAQQCMQKETVMIVSAAGSSLIEARQRGALGLSRPEVHQCTMVFSQETFSRAVWHTVMRG